MRSWLNTFILVNKISFRSLWVRKSFWLGSLIFALCLLILFPFSLGVQVIKRPDVQIGCLWSITEFVAALCIGRMFTAEQEAGALDILLSSRSSHSALLMGKITFSTILLFSLQIPILFFWLVLFNVKAFSYVSLLKEFTFTNLFFAWGSSSLGALIYGVTTRSLAKEILQPILFFPLQTGILLASVAVTLSSNNLSILSGSLSTTAWWNILIFYPIIFCTLACLFSFALLEE